MWGRGDLVSLLKAFLSVNILLTSIVNILEKGSHCQRFIYLPLPSIKVRTNNIYPTLTPTDTASLPTKPEFVFQIFHRNKHEKTKPLTCQALFVQQKEAKGKEKQTNRIPDFFKRSPLKGCLLYILTSLSKETAIQYRIWNVSHLFHTYFILG